MMDSHASLTWVRLSVATPCDYPWAPAEGGAGCSDLAHRLAGVVRGVLRGLWDLVAELIATVCLASLQGRRSAEVAPRGALWHEPTWQAEQV